MPPFLIPTRLTPPATYTRRRGSGMISFGFQCTLTLCTLTLCEPLESESDQFGTYVDDYQQYTEE